MRFREHQGRSKRKTAALVGLLVVAVLGTASGVYLVIYPVYSSYLRESVESFDSIESFDSVEGEEFVLWRWDPRVFGIILAVTLGLMGLAYLLRMSDMRGRGGASVPRRLGGHRVRPDTTDAKERRLLNIVEEMSLAAGMAPPSAYVLPETGINAFAAGYTPNDAVVAVTQGALDSFTREEMQAVVAHEFSHIVSGDVRLSIRIVAAVAAIMTVGIIGKGLVQVVFAGDRHVRVRSGGKNSGGGILLMLVVGACLWAIGVIGAGIGRLIQAAVSRQREFLADATAVQLTRNPAALVKALNRIGSHSIGGNLNNRHASEFAHMFFTSCDTMFASWMATHPPLPDRIGRLGGVVETIRTKPVAPEPAPAADGPELDIVGTIFPSHAATKDMSGLFSAAVVAGAVSRSGQLNPAQLDQAHAIQRALPQMLHEKTRRLDDARAVIYAMVLKSTSDVDVRATQWAYLDQADWGARDRIYAVHQSGINTISPRLYMSVIDLCVPALRTGTADDCRVFLDSVRWLIEADQQTTLTEWAILRMLAGQLRGAGESADPVRILYDRIAPLEEQASCAVSLFAWAGDMSDVLSQQAWRDGMQLLGFKPVAMPVHPPSVGPMLDRVVDAFSQATRPVCLQLLAAIAGVIVVDNEVTLRQEMALRAIADCLHCPIPPIALD